jgi:ferrous iron transport protein A
MDAAAVPTGVSLAPGGTVSLSTLTPGTVATVVGVGSRASAASALERRLIQLGFVSGEHIEIVTQARPGGDPFVVRVGTTTFALRRREVENVWVEIGPLSQA